MNIPTPKWRNGVEKGGVEPKQDQNPAEEMLNLCGLCSVTIFYLKHFFLTPSFHIAFKCLPCVRLRVMCYRFNSEVDMVLTVTDFIV
jgi:hypothetical protein